MRKPEFSGGSVKRAKSKSSTSFRFTGRGVRWIGALCPSCGITEVRLDGVTVARVDAYAPAAQTRQMLFEWSDTTAGDHMLTLIVTGTRRAEASGTQTYVDAFDAGT